MEKIINAITKEEVKLGDIISYEREYRLSFGAYKEFTQVKLTELTLNKLLKEGVLKYASKDAEELTMKFIIKKIGENTGKSFDETINMLASLNRVYPKAVLEILKQTIAIYFYNKHPEKYEDAEGYYVFEDCTRDKIVKVTKKQLSKYASIFITYEEAKEAQNLLRDQFELMYGSNKQKGA